MIKHFSYPIELLKQKDGGYLVKFPDLPEAITQAETINGALLEATDCLEEAIANRIALKLDIPQPTKPKKSQHCVPLHATIVAKVALYLAVREKNLSNTAIAKKLNCNEKQIRRLLDPYYCSKLPKLEHALNVLGYRLEISTASL